MIDHINRTRAGPHPHDRGSGRVRAPAAQVPHHAQGGRRARADFLDAIRSAGRENADVILVGELRGAETMKAALQLASFGILIYATVHTNSRGGDDRSLRQRVPRRSAAADPRPARRLARRRRRAAAAPEGRRRGPRRGARDPDRQPRARVADPRGQDAADRRLHPGRRRRGHADDGRARSRSSSRAGTVKAEAALEKALDKEAFAKAVGLKAQLAP